MRHADISRRLILTAITASITMMALSGSAMAQASSEMCDDDFTVISAIELMTWGQLLGMMLLFGFFITFVVTGVAKYRAISSAVTQSRLYESQALSALFLNRVDQAIKVAVLFPRSPLAVVVEESVRAVRVLEGVNAARWVLDRAIASQATSLRAGLWVLSAIGWTSPMVGLITVLKPLAYSAAESPVGLSFGLMIAIPAIWLHRGLSAEVESLLLETDRMSISIVDQIAEQLSGRFDNQSRVGHHSAS